MSVTTADIARIVGVSQPVVSKVLHGGRTNIRASQATRERILAVASQQGYRRNTAARAIRTGRFGCATLVLSAAGGPRTTLPGNLLRGLSEALEAKKMHLTVASLPDEKLTSEGYVPRILREWMSDGLLINYNREIPQRMIDLIDEYAIPSVWLNCKRDHDCVYPDDFSAGREATRRLLDLGHRRIAYLNFFYQSGASHYSEDDRRDGYRQAMREAGLLEQVVEGAYLEPNGGEKRMEASVRLLTAPDRPTAVVAYCNVSLAHVVRTADQQGLVVPRDLSLITFGANSPLLGQQVATMPVPEVEEGREAVRMLIEKIKSRGDRLPPVLVPFGFFAGRTLAPPSA